MIVGIVDDTVSVIVLVEDWLENAEESIDVAKVLVTTVVAAVVVGTYVLPKVV